MPWEAWFTLACVVMMSVALIRNIAAPDTILLGGLTLIMGGSIFTDRLPSPGALVTGFGNEGLITVAALFIVVTGLSQTGAMAMVVQPLLGRPKTVTAAQTRLMLPVALLSGFLNNTPIVAMFLPVVSDWCKKTGISPSKLFIPLSYAAILGGTCTLIGTSTNLVINGLLIAENNGQHRLGMFDLAWVGVPCAIIGLAYCLIASRWLLPQRDVAFSDCDDPRQYAVEMLVDPASNLVGQTIEQAGLRQLPGLYLVEIDRDGQVIPAVSPKEKLRANDRLVFVGIVESVVDLRKMRGLIPATEQVFKLDAAPTQRSLIEAVVSNSCPLIGKTIRKGRFRSTYNAAVIAVARNGERVKGKIGDITLQPGDTLLLEAHGSFADQQRNSRDFYLVSKIENSSPPRHERAWLALAILGGMVALATAGVTSMLGAAMLAAIAMIVTRCCTGGEAKRSIDWSVLLVIGAAFGIAKAMDTSGAASMLASYLIDLGGSNKWAALVAIYAVTMLFTAFITNNAAAVLVFPLAKATALALDVSLMPFAVALMLAASNDFATPIGYQTNLMVYGPGGYKFTDYLRFGLPLNFLVMGTTIAIAPLVWPF